MSTEVIVVLCACPDEPVAERIARTLVSERLAACVNRLAGVRSVYRWNGAVQDEPETLLLIKSSRERYQELEMRLKALHPYELPEIIALPATIGLDAYLDWIASETSAKA
jgi:periplasmic divalent cation tolerance protein